MLVETVQTVQTVETGSQVFQAAGTDRSRLAAAEKELAAVEELAVVEELAAVEDLAAVCEQTAVVVPSEEEASRAAGTTRNAQVAGWPSA